MAHAVGRQPPGLTPADVDGWHVKGRRLDDPAGGISDDSGGVAHHRLIAFEAKRGHRQHPAGMGGGKAVKFGDDRLPAVIGIGIGEQDLMVGRIDCLQFGF